MKNVARFWVFMAAVCAAWSVYELLTRAPANALWDGVAGLMFLYLGRRTEKPGFFG